MDSTIQIGPARVDEFLAIAALDRQSWGEDHAIIPDGEHTWRIWCEFATVLVARDTTKDDQVVGVLLSFPSEGPTDILHKVFVHDAYRSHGVGSALMKRFTEVASHPAVLTVNPANTRAIGVYERMGFVKQKLVKGYYRPHEDRYVMLWSPPSK